MTSYRDKLSSSYYFIFHDKFKTQAPYHRPEHLVETGMPYSLTAVNKTYTQLGGLQIFKYVNLEFEDVPATEEVNYADDLLDCKVRLARMPGHGFSVTTDEPIPAVPSVSPGPSAT